MAINTNPDRKVGREARDAYQTVSRVKGVTADGKEVVREFVVPNWHAWEPMLERWIQAMNIVEWEYLPLIK